MPLSVKDIVYLEQGRKIKRKEEFEEKKFLFETEQENVKRTHLLLMDLRQIMFSNLCFDNDSARERYFQSLPSIAEYVNPEDRLKYIAKGRGVKRKKNEKAPERSGTSLVENWKVDNR